MKKTDLSSLRREIISAIFKEVPFINQALASNPADEQFFISHSHIFEAAPDEIIIRRGEFENWIYFLLAGQLMVYPEFEDNRKNLVCYISPGEIFGELAYIRELNRNATIVADDNCLKIVYLGTDVTAFGEIDDFSSVSMTTKIAFYQSVVGTIRKRLENMKIDYPENEMALKTPVFRRYSGQKDNMRELLYLQDQAKDFAKYLNKWNRSLESDTSYSSDRGRIPLEVIRSLLNE